MSDRLTTLIGAWGAPSDTPAKVAALAAVVVLGLAFWKKAPLLHEGTERRFLAITSVAAALVSIVYISSYLHGGPRIIDATTYFLQGRALSHGDLAWTPLDPSASFRGRFLIYREATGGEAASLGGIFPPGYPLLLAFGFLLGAPMIVGPLLAAGLVVATYRLARALAEGAGPSLTSLVEPIARSAALLSVVCAALRYHTADTMSHGAAALGITVALEAALRRRGLIAWLAVGYVLATRPVSALPIGIVVAALTWRRDHSGQVAPTGAKDAARAPAGPNVSPRLKPGATGEAGGTSAAPRIGRAIRQAMEVAGLFPGVALLLLSQHAVTGEWLTSTQRMYYALSDGPAGCFRWGFGSGTGCLFEHGDFVHARLASGYGVVEAIGTTVRRLHHHLLDVANLEPLALLVLVPVVKAKGLRARNVRLVTAAIGLHILAYAPFYFDGDYPGGGARFFADVLPIEHALIALGVGLIARSFEREMSLVLALALGGFAVHASFEHGKLRARDGGHPFFENEVLAHASVKQGLVFIDTDHGFATAHDPARSITEGVVFARRRDDDRDRLLYEKLDRPPTYWYRMEAAGPVLVPWMPPEPGPAFRFEGEAEWPALAQAHGFAVPGWTHACASGKRALVLTPDDGEVPATATIEVPVPTAGMWEVTISVAAAEIPNATTRNRTPARGALTIGGERFEWASPEACQSLPSRNIPLSPPRARIGLEARGGPIGLDAVYLRSPGSR